MYSLWNKFSAPSLLGMTGKVSIFISICPFVPWEKPIFLIILIYYCPVRPPAVTTNTVQTFNSCTSRPDVCQCLVVQTPMDNVKIKPSTSMAHLACESMLLWVVRPSMHPCPRNLVASWRAVVYFASYVFSAGIKCRHCSIYVVVVFI